MKTENEMGFWEKWYWANFLRGSNPITTFFRAFFSFGGFGIAIVISLVFCLLTDPQWDKKEGFMHFSIVEYFQYFYFVWKSIITVTFHYIYVYAKYAWDHFGEVVRWFRHVLWLDDPDAFKYVGQD